MAARMLKHEKRPAQREQNAGMRKPAPDGKAIVDTETELYFRDFQNEAAAFDNQLPQLLERYAGQFVAVFNGEVIDHGKNWEELAEKIHKRLPNRFVLLERVEPQTKDVIHMDGVCG